MTFVAGVKRSEAVAMGADVIVVTVSAADGWTAEDTELLNRIQSKMVKHRHAYFPECDLCCCFSSQFQLIQQKEVNSSVPMILVVNKVDCASSSSREWNDNQYKSFCKLIFTCAITGEGIQDLEISISEIVGINKIPAGGRRWIVNQVGFFT